METYNVGQVLYILNSKNLKILPVMIVEEIIRKTVSDTSKQYLVKFPNRDDLVTLETVSDLVFSDIDVLKDHMIQNTKKTIDLLIEKAEHVRDAHFVNEDKFKGKTYEDITDVFSEVDSTLVKKQVEKDNEKTTSNKKSKPGMQKDIRQIIMANEKAS